MDDSETPKKQTRSRRKTNYKGADKKPTSGITPRTHKQKDLIDAIKGSKQVLILGPAGTGKTYVTATCAADIYTCLLYTSPSPRDRTRSRMPSSA